MSSMLLAPDPTFAIRALQHALETGSRWAEVGSNPKTGLSCYGLVRWTFHLAGVALPESPHEADASFVAVEPPYEPWDMVCANFSGVIYGTRHVGLLMAPTWGYHCSQPTNGIARFDLQVAPWRRVVRHGWRLKVYVCA